MTLRTTSSKFSSSNPNNTFAKPSFRSQLEATSPCTETTSSIASPSPFSSPSLFSSITLHESAFSICHSTPVTFSKTAKVSL